MMIKVRKVFFLYILVAITFCNAWSQRFRTEAYRSYIDKHAGEAVQQMKKHRIPASVTMAQALIESGAGRSSLSKDFNNHFGIKCHSSWKGEKIYRRDNYHNECFRVYNNWQDSYEDHSIFLKQKRYRNLFSYNIYDYGNWSRELQRAGYATDKGYANTLIAIIESCELYLLDKGEMPLWVSNGATKEIKINQGYIIEDRAKNKKEKQIQRAKLSRDSYISYGLLYVIAKNGDSYSSIAEDFDMSPIDIALYNDTPEDFPLKAGDIVYLQYKNSRATSQYPIYEVKIGDSMHSISQFFGIKLGALYDLNEKGADYVPEEGDILRLR